MELADFLFTKLALLNLQILKHKRNFLEKFETSMASIIVWYIILQQQQQQCLFSSSSRCVCLLTCWKDDLRFWRCSSQRSSMEAARRSKRPLQPRQVSTLFRKQRPLQQLKPRALSRPRGSVQKTCIFKSQSWRATLPPPLDEEI